MQAHHRVSHPGASAPANGDNSGIGPSRTLGRAGRLLQAHTDKPVSSAPKAAKQSLWDGWSSAQAEEVHPFDAPDDQDRDDLDLNALGL